MHENLTEKFYTAMLPDMKFVVWDGEIDPPMPHALLGTADDDVTSLFPL